MPDSNRPKIEFCDGHSYRDVGPSDMCAHCEQLIQDRIRDIAIKQLNEEYRLEQFQKNNFGAPPR